jgi:hypothetical protein
MVRNVADSFDLPPKPLYLTRPAVIQRLSTCDLQFRGPSSRRRKEAFKAGWGQT